MQKILVLDNYDSFTYNLVYLLQELAPSAKIEVHRNDKIDLAAVEQFDKILLSPGPGIPDEAGIMPALIQTYAQRKNILGICLGHQAIGEAFGAELDNISEVLHGVASDMEILSEDVLFEKIPKTFAAAHYHSWVVEGGSVKTPLEIIAQDKRGLVMGIRHTEYNVRGLQFHPESVLTPQGKQIMKNWILSKNKTFTNSPF